MEGLHRRGGPTKESRDRDWALTSSLRCGRSARISLICPMRVDGVLTASLLGSYRAPVTPGGGAGWLRFRFLLRRGGGLGRASDACCSRVVDPDGILRVWARRGLLAAGLS